MHANSLDLQNLCECEGQRITAWTILQDLFL